MKRIVIVILTLTMLLTLCACGRKGREEISVIRIGVLEPRSGKYSAEGMRETLGIQYANETMPTLQLNGKTYEVELVLTDDASSAEGAVSAAESLVTAGCCAVIGSFAPEASAAASDVFLSAGLPAIAASSDDPLLTQGNDHYFRICCLPAFQGTALASYARNTLGAKSAYCLVQSGDEAQAALLRAFRQQAEALEVMVTVAEFPANCTDFTPWLNGAKDAGVGVIFAPCAIRYAQRLIEQSEENEIGIPLLAGDSWDDDAILSAAEERSVNVYVCVMYAEGADAEFDEGFKGWLNSNSEALAYNGGSDGISPLSALGYDAYMTVLSAIRLAGRTDKADVLAILPRVSCAGVSGSFVFDDDGDAVRSAAWIKKADPETGTWLLAGAAKVS